MTRRIAFAALATLALATAADAQNLPNARYNAYTGGYVSPALMNTPYGNQIADTLYSPYSSAPYNSYLSTSRVYGNYNTITTYNPAAGAINTSPNQNGALGGRSYTFGANPVGGTVFPSAGSTLLAPNPFAAPTGTPGIGNSASGSATNRARFGY